MNIIKRTSLIAVLIIFCLGLFSAGAVFAAKSKKIPVIKIQPKSVLVFQFDQSVDLNLPDGFGVMMATALRNKLGSMDQYIAVLFSDRLSSVKRGKDDNSLKTPEITAPFSEDNDKPLKLAKLLSADTFITGNIESVSVDTAAQTSTMTVSGGLFDGKTGNVLTTWVITGRAPQLDKNANDDELIALAAGQVIQNIVDQINVSAAPLPTNIPEPVK